MDRFSTQAKDCMRSLLHCHAMCLSTAMTRYIETHDQHNRPQHVRLILDCATACGFAADMIAHKSQFHAQACALCAEICDTCAKDCDQLGLQDCAAACRDSAAHSRQMAKLDHAEIIEMASRLPPTR